MIKKKNNSSLDNLKSCPDPYQFFKYVDGTLDVKAEQEVEKHLNLCPSCFKEMTSLVRHTLSPIKPDEHAALKHMINISQEEQVSRILTYGEQEFSYLTKLRKVGLFSIFNIAYRYVRENLFGKKPRFRPVWIVGTMFVIFFTMFFSITYFRTKYPIRQAQQLLRNNYRIFIENPRLSGGYRSTGISMLMSADDKSSAYLEKAKNHLLNSIHRGNKSQTAIQLLAQIHVIEKKYSQADSLMNNILNHFSHTASVYNDLGVLYAEQKQLRKATNEFRSALAIDNHFREAYYNLALIKIESGAANEAISLLSEYLNIETDTSWKDAAEHLLDEIKREKGRTVNN